MPVNSPSLRSAAEPRKERLHRERTLPNVAPSAAVPSFAEAAVLVSRIAALGAGFWTVYQNAGSGIPIALLIFASVLRQHVGAEAALGLVFVAIAIARSSPAAASLPSTD